MQVSIFWKLIFYRIRNIITTPVTIIKIRFQNNGLDQKRSANFVLIPPNIKKTKAGKPDSILEICK